MFYNDSNGFVLIEDSNFNFYRRIDSRVKACFKHCFISFFLCVWFVLLPFFIIVLFLFLPLPFFLVSSNNLKLILVINNGHHPQKFKWKDCICNELNKELAFTLNLRLYYITYQLLISTKRTNNTRSISKMEYNE